MRSVREAEREAPEPSPDELLAMAWADGELVGDEARAFGERLSREPALALEVARHERLAVLARAVAPPEPADAEWARLALDPVQRGGRALGWTLFGLGAAGVTVWLTWALLASALALAPKLVLVALWTGFLVLVVATVHARLRTLPYDPYTEVER